MAENKHTHGTEGLHDPDVKHERSDVNARALTRFGIGFALALIGSLFIVFLVFDTFRGEKVAKVPPAPERLNVDARKLPPDPRLQAAPADDLNGMRAAEDRILNGYAWLDRNKGSVRIPIDRAMDLVAQENLPHRNTNGPTVDDTATVPAESGMGPIMTQVGGPLSPNRTWPPAQPLEIHGTGDPRDGRQAGGQPTPPQYSLGNESSGVTPPGPGAAPQQSAAPRQQP